MQYSSSLLAVAGLLTTVAGHGSLIEPPPRPVGPGYRAVCGEQVYNQQLSDRNGNIQGILQVASSQTDVTDECNFWLCKGFQFSDNAANVQTYTAGQVVPMTFNIAAPHTGPANVSIIYVPTGDVIGAPLITWDQYASNSVGPTADQRDFTITIPADLGDQCATAGDCVLQHWWDARSVDQTYESCVDFTVGGSGTSPTTPSTPPVGQPAVPPADVPSQPTTLVTSTRPAPTVPPVAAPVTPPVPATPPTTYTTGGGEEEEDEECE
ncbi:hypothetical protein LZ554_000195 [Drepanopeziza brunnea f. sp. 'monogermtubi']|nr:hypothetical protein LZ554_000195 [Drepanopeziza brunnea f. sp. 'monogermtubi']